MKHIIVCSIVLIFSTDVLHCKNYLVEVDDDGTEKSTPNNAVTVADQQEDNNEAGDKIDVEDVKEINDSVTDGIDIRYSLNNVNDIIPSEGADYLAKERTCFRCREKSTEEEVKKCLYNCCQKCLHWEKKKEKRMKCLSERGIKPSDCCPPGKICGRFGWF